MKFRPTRAQQIGWFVLLTALTALAWVRVIGGCSAQAPGVGSRSAAAGPC